MSAVAEKFCSKPRKVRVIYESGFVLLFRSVSEAARGVGMGRTQVQGMLSGRCGKRASFKVEYIEVGA